MGQWPSVRRKEKLRQTYQKSQNNPAASCKCVKPLKAITVREAEKLLTRPKREGIGRRHRAVESTTPPLSLGAIRVPCRTESSSRLKGKGVDPYDVRDVRSPCKGCRDDKGDNPLGARH